MNTIKRTKIFPKSLRVQRVSSTLKSLKAQQIADFYTKLAIQENKTPEQLTNKLKAI